MVQTPTMYDTFHIRAINEFKYRRIHTTPLSLMQEYSSLVTQPEWAYKKISVKKFDARIVPISATNSNF